MTEQRLRHALREMEAPHAGAARARTLEAALGARAERPARTRSARLRPFAIMACAVAVAAVSLTPPGDAVADWISRVVNPRPRPAPAPTRALPADGRLLVTAGQRAWIVRADGRRKSLGSFDGATWSPRGLLVAAWRGWGLTALEPSGRVRWAIRAPGRIRAAVWSPQGFHVVYLTQSHLRVVSGRGLGDSPLRRAPEPGSLSRTAAGRVVPVTPAFRPGAPRTLAFVDGERRVEVIDVYTGALLWRSRNRVGARARALSWTADGSRLLALTATAVQRWTADGRSLGRTPLGTGRVGVALAPAPRGRRVALTQVDRATGRGEVVFAGSAGAPLFEGRGRFDALQWSPDGRWLMVSWPSADQWLFLRPDRRSLGGVAAMRGITRRFGEPTAALGGWCCP